MRFALLSLLLLVAACTTPLEATVVPIPAAGLKVGHQADGLHRVAYTERARKMDAAARDKYLVAFRAAYVAKGDKTKPIELKP